ncbi:aminotransferase class V-fold PLP-dependent enzyme [Acuticoccus sp.]|uniref:aminotransferase class V-fold PLP-dependent enzyme n=1 Tax=Acuticoccus sp. TaxID=1904378 RepID=UPI003B518B40
MSAAEPIERSDTALTPLRRPDFPAATNLTYVNTCSTGIMSTGACAAANAVNEAIRDGRFAKEAYAPMLRETRQRMAGLIHAAADEIAVVKNVSEGLNAVACALPWQPGDNVVVCLELEHPNNVYLWLKLAQTGVELRDVPPSEGAIDADAMAAAIDARTRLVTASSVTFTPGFRTDLAPIGEAARAVGALFLVDAVQSAGVLQHDVEAERIDALATSTTKNLLGTSGLGFLYVRRDWAQRLTPAYVSRYSVARGTGHESEIEGSEVRFAPDASRFETGNHNWPGIAAAHASLGELSAAGVAAIERHAVRLADRLRDGFGALGLAVSHPPRDELRTHMVTVGERGTGNAYSTADERLNWLADAYKSSGVAFTVRRGMLRFGFHGFNDDGDVDTVLAVSDDALRQAA